MAVVNRVDKRVKISKDDIIKYQIITYCFLNNIQISKADLQCLTELGKLKAVELNKFCSVVSEKKIFKSPQSCRNAIQKSKKKGLIEKDSRLILLSSDIQLQVDGTVYLDYKLLSVEKE
tara:strand:- start:5788 stop:6144 length:357 start_codon:yes stop_codon:yes gene_type:complete